MPVTIQPAALKYKNSQEQYQTADCLRGEDGLSPSVTVTDIAGGHRVTVTDANGAHTFDVMDGASAIDDTAGAGDTDKVWSADKSSELLSALNEKYTKPQTGIPASDLASGVIPTVPVIDVQIEGASILSQGVANIPYASANALGLTATRDYFGMQAIATGPDKGRLQTVKATDADIKTGTNGYKPIVPSNQQAAVFYGLAKAAGDSTQSSSNNAVGTYTDTAKAAIQTMLGVNSMLAPVEADLTADAAYSIGQEFAYNGKLYKATSAIAIGDTITPGTNCTETKIADELNAQKSAINVLETKDREDQIARSGLVEIEIVEGKAIQSNGTLADSADTRVIYFNIADDGCYSIHNVNRKNFSGAVGFDANNAVVSSGVTTKQRDASYSLMLKRSNSSVVRVGLTVWNVGHAVSTTYVCNKEPYVSHVSLVPDFQNEYPFVSDIYNSIFALPGVYYVGSSATFSTDSSLSSYGYIPVHPGDTIKLEINSASSYASFSAFMQYYNQSFGYISAAGFDTSYTVPENAYYAAIMLYTADIEKVTLSVTYANAQDGILIDGRAIDYSNIKMLMSPDGYIFNPDNRIPDPYMKTPSAWTLVASDSTQSWTEVENGCNIFNCTTVTANKAKIMPKTVSTGKMGLPAGEIILYFKVKCDTLAEKKINLYLSATDSQNNTDTLIRDIRYTVWNTDDTLGKWHEIGIRFTTTKAYLYFSAVITLYDASTAYHLTEMYVAPVGENNAFYIQNGGIGYNDLKTEFQNGKTLYGKKVLCFGDSITDNGVDTMDDVATGIARNTGANVLNAGFGGCQMAQHTTGNYDPFSMYRLAYSMVNNSWTLQDAAILDGTNIPSRAAEKIAKLKAVNLNEYDQITIAYGTNDWANDVQLENVSDPDDTTTFAGALRYSLETLLTAYPHLKVNLCCPTYRLRWSGSTIDTDSDTMTNTNDATLGDFIEKMKDISEEYHVHFIDLYNNTGFNKVTYPYFYYVGDGIHPNVRGRKVIAEIICKNLCA